MEFALLITLVLCFLSFFIPGALMGGGGGDSGDEKQKQKTEWKSGAIVNGLKTVISNMNSDAQNKINKK